MTGPSPRALAVRLVRRSDRTPSRGLRILAVATAAVTYLLIVVGGVVRTSGSGLGCGAAGGRNDWPYCQGGLLPPLQREAVIEFSHRWLAAAVSACALALLAIAWARYRHLRAVTWTSTVFTVLLAVQVVLGAVTVYNLLPPDVVMLHLANAEVLLGCGLLLCILTFNGGRLRRAAPASVPAARRAAARWSAAAAMATYALVLSGAFVVDRGAGLACSGWPLCGGGLQLDSSRLATYNLGHRILAGVVTVLLAVAVMRCLRAGRAPAVRLASIAIGVMLLAQVVAGAVLVDSQLPAAVRSVHEALASGLWAAVILLALLARPALVAFDGDGGGAAARARRTDEAAHAAPRPVPARSSS